MSGRGQTAGVDNYLEEARVGGTRDHENRTRKGGGIEGKESRLLGGGRGEGEALVAAAGLPGVKLRQGALRNSLQHFLGEDPEQLPADVQSLVHGPVVVWT